MSHDHDHHHGDHDHPHVPAGVEGTWADPQADDLLSVSRRAFLATAAVVAGAAAGVAGAAGGLGQGVAAAHGGGRGQTANPWSGRSSFLAGDHHIHSQFSPDAQYEVATQAAQAREFGLDWIVITDHGGVAHQKLSIDKITPEIEAARSSSGICSSTRAWSGTSRAPSTPPSCSRRGGRRWTS